MTEPIRSAGAVPKRWKRRQHAERQARLRQVATVGDNPVRIIPGIDRSDTGLPPIGEVRIVQGPVLPHGTRRTETLRAAHRWNSQDGKLLSLHARRQCSACSRWLLPGTVAWRNPYAQWWTCTRCQPVEPLDP